MVDCLPSSLKTLGLIPSTADKQRTIKARMEERKGERRKMGRKEGQNPKRFKKVKQCLKEEGMKGREEERCKDTFGRCSGP